MLRARSCGVNAGFCLASQACGRGARGPAGGDDRDNDAGTVPRRVTCVNSYSGIARVSQKDPVYLALPIENNHLCGHKNRTVHPDPLTVGL